LTGGKEKKSMKISLIIKNAAQLVTPIPNKADDFGMEQLKIIENGAIAIAADKIVAVGETKFVTSQVDITAETEVINATGKTITPGLIDPHTHPIFYATREEEFEMRVLGKSYQEIAEAGGGIRSTVRSLRKAGKDDLIAAVLPRMQWFLENGVTTIEAKSGYGLSLADEIKSLEVIREVNERQPVDLVPTFLGAHEIPDEFRDDRKAYIRKIIQEMIPEIHDRGLAEFCDVFCEEGVYSAEEAREILSAGKRAGLQPKIHANQLSEGGGARIACEVGAISAEHLDRISDADIQLLYVHQVVPVLLPGAVFFLNLDHYAPARKMIEAGLPVALSTDFNPGTSMTEALPFIMTLACIKMHLTPAEALIACTRNAARAINRHEQIGSLETGKKGDVVVWDVPNYRHLAYHFGVQLTDTVLKNGTIVYKKKAPYRENKGLVREGKI
jgi:imidazolonepropionase